jgi:parvulin-like peptidyl-prolyl isomerase
MKQWTAVLLLLAAAIPVRAQTIIEQILVKVNGEIFTKTDLEQRQIAALRQRNQQFTEADLQNDEQLKKVLADITPSLLVEAVDELLITQQGKELGYKLTAEQFKSAVDNLKKDNNIQSDAQLQAALRQEGMTMDDLRRQMEKMFLIRQIQGDVVEKVGVTEEDARAYYAAHPKEFTTPAEVTLREILVEIPTITRGGEKVLNVAEEERVAARAAEARRRIAAGEDFAKVASEMSDAASKDNGGLVGPIKREELAPAIQELLTKLKPGEVSEPLRTSRGYQLLKVESMTEPTLQPFDKVRDLIADKVYTQKRDVEFEKYVRTLRTRAIIEWKNEELKKAYERQLAAEAAAVTGQGM